MAIEKKHSVLIVEDEMALVEVLEDHFSEEGFEVLIAKDGKVGLDMALKLNPDIILLDIIMPIMDGITMLEKLRKDEKAKEIPVIMLTNLSDAKRVEEARKQGVNDYLVKADWKLEDVVNKVKGRR